MSRSWYELSPADVLRELDTTELGLSEAEAQRRLEQYGPNEIEFRKTPAWRRLLRQFYDPMVIILLATALVTGVLTLMGSHMLPDTVVIVGVVLLNAILGFVQEGKAEGALEALRNMMVYKALVVRDGEERRIAAGNLAPGDILVLDSGDKVPADVRLIETNNTYVDESSLTGESVPAKKWSAALGGQDLVPGDQTNMAFSGTFLTGGTARAAVVETGMQTVFGQIADMVKTAQTHQTPLQRRLKQFIRTLIVAILLVGGFNFAFGVYLGYDTVYSFLGAVSLVVAAIPEMLPALVTSILALSCVVMARRKALIRTLPAAETLGSTSVICSDKTGTLTENRMTVTRVYSGGQVFDVTGTGFAIEGEFQIEGVAQSAAEEPALMRLLECGFHCNNSHLSGEAGIGDPTELALRISGAKAEITPDNVHRLEEIPFDSSAKYMAVLIDDSGRRSILVKGAPEVVVRMCTTQLDSTGFPRPLHADEALGTARLFARNALRTLGFAIKELPGNESDLRREDLSNMCFVGLQGMIDPPRPSAIEAVERCKCAGIRTVMITGDHPETAQAVARQLRIPAERIVSGAELSRLSESKLEEQVSDVSVFARVAPEHKKAIAEALQTRGLVVAMTGDGVNDAPALKAADIGVAMGISGTEVAKEASDMVLADDNFATIVAAVEEGRHAWNNLQKAILYTLPTNAAQALLIMVAILLAGFVPVFAARFVLEPVQILWINLLDSVLLTMPLMMEPKEHDLLAAPPRNAKARIINALFIQRVMILGLAIAVPGCLIYYHFGAPAVVEGNVVDDLLLTQAQTAAFWAILLAHFGYVVSARSVDKSFFRIHPFSNPWLLAGIIASIAIRFVPTLVPSASALFRTAVFPNSWWPLILLCLLPSFLAIETDKAVRSFMRRASQIPG